MHFKFNVLLTIGFHKLRRSILILTDNTTKIDLLNNEAIALTVIELLKKHSHEPVTICIMVFGEQENQVFLNDRISI